MVPSAYIKIILLYSSFEMGSRDDEEDGLTWEEFMRSKKGDYGAPGTALAGSIFNWDETMLLSNGDAVGAARLYKERMEVEAAANVEERECAICSHRALESALQAEREENERQRNAKLEAEEAAEQVAELAVPHHKRFLLRTATANIFEWMRDNPNLASRCLDPVLEAKLNADAQKKLLKKTQPENAQRSFIAPATDNNAPSSHNAPSSKKMRITYP